MGMYTSVYGIKPADKKFKEMEKIYHLCNEQGITIPVEVDDFFNGEIPDSKGVIVGLDNKQGVSKYHEEMQEGFEVNLKKLPEDIKFIRFVNNY